MRKIIHMDLVLNRSAVLVNALVFAGFMSFIASQSDVRVGVFAFFSTMMVTFLPVGIVMREDRYKASVLACSLPVTRRTIVRARYVLMLGMSAVGILAAMTLGSALPFSHLPAEALFSGRVLGMALAAAAVLTGVLLPFVLRFGHMGLIAALVSLQVLGAVLLIVAQVTRSSADKRIVAAIARAVGGVHARLGPAGFDMALAAFVCLFLAASYAIALRVFERREF